MNTQFLQKLFISNLGDILLYDDRTERENYH